MRRKYYTIDDYFIELKNHSCEIYIFLYFHYDVNGVRTVAPTPFHCYYPPHQEITAVYKKPVYFFQDDISNLDIGIPSLCNKVIKNTKHTSG
jgi:hypothetical protein